MADVLSQQEIDALLSALNSGELQVSEVEEKKEKVKVYDFKRAMRYSKEQLRSISRIHENFTRLMTSYISGQLRTFVQIEIELVDQVTYREFIASLPSKTIMTIFDVKPMDAKIALDVNSQVAYAILERLLGGQGGLGKNGGGTLTEIEMSLIQSIFSRLFDLYANVWENIEELSVKWEAIESNPQFIQIAAANDTVILVALKTTIGEITGTMTLCLPHLVIEPVLPKLSTHQWYSTIAKTNGPQQDKIMHNLDTVRVPVTAELGRASIQVADLLNLEVGDVIGIETGQIHVKVGNFTKFIGNPGIQKGHYAIQIDKVIQAEGDDL